jgi:cyanobactin maturation PatA/PatG family protease
MPAGSIASIPGLLDLWAKSTGDPRVTIAVLDGPVDRTHPALVGANLTTLEVVVSAAPQPGGVATRHGTLTASLIFGQHGSGRPVTGIAPRCRGIIVPVFGDFEKSAVLDPESDRPFTPVCSQLDLARAILLAAEQGAQVINISGGQYAPTGVAHPILADAVRQCARRRILIVAAAGNDGCECLHVPAALPGVLAVGAMNAHGEPLETSNWGRSYRTGGLLAPGTGLLGAKAGGGTAVVSGTSFATAVVSGAAGLLWSVALQDGRNLDGARVRSILLSSAEKCVEDSLSCRRALAGRLDLARAGSIIGKVRESGEIPLDSAEKCPDDLRLCSRWLAERLNLARAGTLLQIGNSRMSDETLPQTTSADLLSPGSNVAIKHAADEGRTSAAEWAHSLSPSPAVTASEGCGCAACRAKASGGGGLVFALGQVGYDLVSEARRDSIQQYMEGANPNPLDPAQILGYLNTHEWEAASILWTLNADQVPLYAVAPTGPFAAKGFELLREFLEDQLSGQVELVSIPGRLAGQARLLNGQVLPVINPEPRGMYSWTIGALIQSVVGEPLPASARAQQRAAHARKAQGVRGFLQKVYHELRNLGVTAEDRAINHAATNAYQIGQVFESVLKETMELDSITVERSPICRLDSDCWDVKLHFFYPEREFQTVRKVYRFTVDVSDVVPVTVGPMRSWFVR